MSSLAANRTIISIIFTFFSNNQSFKLCGLYIWNTCQRRWRLIISTGDCFIPFCLPIFPAPSDHPVKPYFHRAAAVFSPHPHPQFFTVVLRQGFILWARVLYITQADLEFRILVLSLPEITVLGLQERITPSDELYSQPTAWFFLNCKIAPLAELVTMTTQAFLVWPRHLA